jgi:hypothetical protein
MRCYRVCPSLNHQECVALVLATGPVRPEEELDAVADDLRAQGVRGKVVFDLLLANGTHTRRYFSIDFDGTRFSPARFVHMTPNAALLRASVAFFAANRGALDVQVLTPAMRVELVRDIEQLPTPGAKAQSTSLC